MSSKAPPSARTEQNQPSLSYSCPTTQETKQTEEDTHNPSKIGLQSRFEDKPLKLFKPECSPKKVSNEQRHSAAQQNTTHPIRTNNYILPSLSGVPCMCIRNQTSPKPKPTTRPTIVILLLLSLPHCFVFVWIRNPALRDSASYVCGDHAELTQIKPNPTQRKTNLTSPDLTCNPTQLSPTQSDQPQSCQSSASLSGVNVHQEPSPSCFRLLRLPSEKLGVGFLDCSIEHVNGTSFRSERPSLGARPV